MDVIHFFDRGVYLAPDADAFVMGERRWTYREAQRLTRQVASALVRDGVARGARVAVLSPNDPTAFLCVLGLLRAQMVWVPLNPRNADASQLGILERFGYEVILYHSSFDALVATARQANPRLRHAICIDSDDTPSPSLAAWIGDAPDHFDIAPADPNDVVALFTTGGTTGLPKGVMQTHLFYENLVSSYLAMMPSDTPPRFLAAAPLTHATGLFCFPVFARAGTVFVIPAARPLAIAEAVTRYRITDTLLPPTVIYGLLAEPTIGDFDFSSMKYLWYGTAPMDPARVREAIDVLGPCLVSGWGQSEAVMLTFLSSSDLVRDGRIHERRLSSCGRKFPFMDVAAMSPEGTVLGPNEVGELVTRGNGVMKGYFEDPAATAEASRFGWHHTGDVGYQDDEGYFYIVDRIKDMIISGGFNLFPSEIERVLFAHPAVQDCAVVGVPDDKWGEAVAAFVQVKAGCTVTEEALIALCRERLGAMKTPKLLSFRDELPRSPVGKILKRELREPFWAAGGRKV